MPTPINRQSLNNPLETRYNNASSVGSAGGNAKTLVTNGGYSPLRNSVLSGQWTKSGFKTRMMSQQTEFTKPDKSLYVKGHSNIRYK